jgi:hypothetical protein
LIHFKTPVQFILVLVVEETNVLLHEGDAQLLGSLKDSAVVLAAAGGSNILGT